MRVYRVSASTWGSTTANGTGWSTGQTFTFDLHADNYAGARTEAEAILQDLCDGMRPLHWRYTIDYVLPTIFPSCPRSGK